MDKRGDYFTLGFVVGCVVGATAVLLTIFILYPMING